MVGRAPKATPQEMGKGLGQCLWLRSCFWRWTSWMSCQPPQEEGGMWFSTSVLSILGAFCSFGEKNVLFMSSCYFPEVGIHCY